MIMRGIATCLAIALVSLVCSCAKQDDSVGDKRAEAMREAKSSPQAQPGAVTPTPEPAAEEYEEMAASDGLVFALMDVSAVQEIGEGGVRIPDGTFKELLCNGKTVPVANNRIDAGFITTRDCGRIKVVLRSMSAGFTVYLTPTQKKQFAQFK